MRGDFSFGRPPTGHCVQFAGFVATSRAGYGITLLLDFGPAGLSLVCLHPDAFSLFKNKVTTSCVIEEMVPEMFGNTVVAQ
ncbi:hypothetical protein ACFIOY_18005 [Bradyrhizobium sp. TZ2]